MILGLNVYSIFFKECKEDRNFKLAKTLILSREKIDAAEDIQEINEIHKEVMEDLSPHITTDSSDSDIAKEVLKIMQTLG